MEQNRRKSNAFFIQASFIHSATAAYKAEDHSSAGMILGLVCGRGRMNKGGLYEEGVTFPPVLLHCGDGASKTGSLHHPLRRIPAWQLAYLLRRDAGFGS